jgi:hypothetical protein
VRFSDEAKVVLPKNAKHRTANKTMGLKIISGRAIFYGGNIPKFIANLPLLAANFSIFIPLLCKYLVKFTKS